MFLQSLTDVGLHTAALQAGEERERLGNYVFSLSVNQILIATVRLSILTNQTFHLAMSSQLPAPLSSSQVGPLSPLHALKRLPVPSAWCHLVMMVGDWVGHHANLLPPGFVMLSRLHKLQKTIFTFIDVVVCIVEVEAFSQIVIT